MAERIRALWERLRADIHKNPGLWIGVGLTAAVLLIAWLAYRKSQGQGVVPANGYGFPDYGSSSGGGGGGVPGGGYNPFQPPAPGQPVTPFPVDTTPPPATAYPPFPPFSLTPSSPAQPYGPAAHVIGNANDQGAPAHVVGSVNDQGANASHVVGSANDQGAAATSGASGATANAVQNPTKAAQLEHRGTSPAKKAVAAIQNPLKAAQLAHRGATPHPATHPHAQAVHVPHVNFNTKQPRNSGHGRVA